MKERARLCDLFFAIEKPNEISAVRKFRRPTLSISNVYNTGKPLCSRLCRNNTKGRKTDIGQHGNESEHAIRERPQKTSPVTPSVGGRGSDAGLAIASLILDRVNFFILPVHRARVVPVQLIVDFFHEKNIYLSPTSSNTVY